ncbi:MAG: PBP1A family penicillin-binding protein [Methylobacteriaceae bacterium]|jgi:penicillin-binding protein 1A|nr:PBP1A family penicillin-binding protein [Methylobacteriaceae bacterium]
MNSEQPSEQPSEQLSEQLSEQPSEQPSAPASDSWEEFRRCALKADAWIDDTLYRGGMMLEDFWDRVCDFSNSMRVRGLKRLVLDLMSEGVSLSIVGLLATLCLAKPAFELTTDDYLKTQHLSVVFLDRYGQEIGHRGVRYDDTYNLEDYPEHLIKAALATEDRRFYEHWGIDPIGTARALSVNAKAGGVRQGGSSITQQLAKNLFLNNEQTLDRKIKEAFLSIWLEAHLTKDEILKLYLDRAYMGAGVHGVAAAAEFYFDKSVKDLNLAESAMLAGLFKAPSRYAPHINLPVARARAADVLNNMVEAGFATRGQVQAALRNPATPVTRRHKETPEFYLDWAFSNIKELDVAGKFGQERVLTVKTPFDPTIQYMSDKALSDAIRQSGKGFRFRQGAIVVMDVDGAVRAMTGGPDYGQSQFNRATDALRQPGSSFKPFVYAAALTALPKLRPNSTVVDTQICLGNWCPSNYGHSFAGSVPMWLAVAKSINTIPVRLSVQIGKGNAKAGRKVIIETAEKMGLTHKLADSSPLPIGAAEVTVLDMAASYSVFGNGGFRAKPYAALEVYGAGGDIIYAQRNNPAPERVLEDRVVADMNLMLNKVVTTGTGKRAAIPGLPQAGKTGTTNAYRDAWYVGYSGNMSAAIWLGNDNNSPMAGMTGGTIPAQIWREVMTVAHHNVELKPVPFLQPPATAKPMLTASATKVSVEGVLSKQSWEAINGIGTLLTQSRSAFRTPFDTASIN